MKKLFLVLAMAFILTGCASVNHKNITAKYSGFGVDVDYTSIIAIDAKDIPSFIAAVDKLEKLLKGK